MKKEKRKIHTTLACNADIQLMNAALPLLHSGEVDALEWSFDTLYKLKNVPSWFQELLHAFGNEDRLIGHGVFFSILSAHWSKEQEGWLQNLRDLSKQYHFSHITEHFGFLTGQHFHEGAPLSVPYTNDFLRIGRDRLQRISEACKCPVGIENLAFSFSEEETQQQGEFLNDLLEPINGFLILDLHNLYCQIHNFNSSFKDLIRYYPLEKVREIHISGGSWKPSEIEEGKSIRRDTHDDGVPDEVYEMLQKTIPLCPNLKYVVLEQIGNSLQRPESKINYQKDFKKLRQILSQINSPISDLVNNFLPQENINLGNPIQSDWRFLQQEQLADILENCNDYNEAVLKLGQSTLANSDWKIEQWSPRMLETAIDIAKKWKNGF